MDNNTAEEYLEFNPDAKSQDAALLPTVETFQGKRLYPYSPGVKTLLQDLLVGAMGGDRYLLLLMHLLIDLQVHHDAVTREASEAKIVVEQDDITEAAIERFLEQVGGRPLRYQANVVMRTGKMRSEAVKEALEVAERIYERAKKSELKSTDVSEVAEPGK